MLNSCHAPQQLFIWYPYNSEDTVLCYRESFTAQYTRHLQPRDVHTLRLNLNPKLYKKLNSKFGTLHPHTGHYLEYSEVQLTTVAWTSTTLKKDKKIKVLNKDLQ